MYQRSWGSHIQGHVDSDYVGDLDKQRSTMAYVFIMSNGPASWRSILRGLLTLCTAKAEHIAVTEVIKEALWL